MHNIFLQYIFIGKTLIFSKKKKVPELKNVYLIVQYISKYILQYQNNNNNKLENN